MNMKLLAVVTPPYIYHGCSTRKTFLEEKFTPKNMKHCGRRNVSKHRDIKNGKKYITLDISSDSVSLDNMKIKPSEKKYYLGISGKVLITSLGIKSIIRPKGKKARYAITNVSMNEISNIIKEFEILPYDGYV